MGFTPALNLFYPDDNTYPEAAQLKQMADTTEAAIQAFLTGALARKTYSPVWSQDSGATLAINDGNLWGWYAEIGPLVVTGLRMGRGANTNLGSGPYRFSLPVPNLTWYMMWGSAMVQSTPATPVGINSDATRFGISMPGGARVSNTNPGGWAAGQILSALVVYWRA